MRQVAFLATAALCCGLGVAATRAMEAPLRDSAAASSWPLQQLTAASTNSSGVVGNGASSAPSLSANSRYVAFASVAKNLVIPPTNGRSQIFVKDLTTGSVNLASSGRLGAQGNGASTGPNLSADGRFVVFQSVATNLVTDASNGKGQIFVKDLRTGSILRVSQIGTDAGSASSSAPVISANAAWVAFQSAATNLAAACSGSSAKILARPRAGGAVICISTDADGKAANAASTAPSISNDGRYVAFQSAATNLDPACANGLAHIFIKDRTTGAVRCASRNAAGAFANAASAAPALAPAGGYVAFQSAASNLDPACVNRRIQIFVKNLKTGTVRCVSRNASGVPGNGASTGAVLSSDGQIVGFLSGATNLVAGDTNGKTDLFIRRTGESAIHRLNAPLRTWLQANGNSAKATLTSDGHYVAFDSVATNLVAPDTNAASDVFVDIDPVFRPKISRITKLSVPGTPKATLAGIAPAGEGDGYSGIDFINISDDDQVVSFATQSVNIVPEGCSDDGVLDYYVAKDVATGLTTCSVHPYFEARDSYRFSANRRYEVFFSSESTFDPDCFRVQNIFLRDNQTGVVTCLSKNAKGVHGNGQSSLPSISPDGTKVMFASASTNLVAGAVAGWTVLYLKDLTTGSLNFASTSPKGDLVQITFVAYPRFSPDGGSILYSYRRSGPPGPPPFTPPQGTVLKKLSTGVAQLLPSDPQGIGIQTFFLSRDWKHLIGYGCTRTFPSNRGGLAVYDLEAGTDKCASTNAAGVEGNNYSAVTVPTNVSVDPWVNPVISDDGRFVVFVSLADNLVPGDENLSDDIFVKDMESGAIRRVSVASNGEEGTDNSYGPSISADDRFVLFGSYSPNLVPGDNEICGEINCPDVFLVPNPLYH